jgi:hypothetical protein
MSRKPTSALVLFTLVLACRTDKGSQPPPQPDAKADTPAATDDRVAAKTSGLTAAALRPHLEFLASDAQEGRLPGTEADDRVQGYVEKAMQKAGLSPAFEGGWRQSFTITDGVRVVQGEETVLDASGLVVAHSPVPFSGTTVRSGPAVAKLVFVGHGIPKGGKNTGDYAGLAKKVNGAIVVALAGAPDDPHIGQAEKRAQSKAIAARDHGAIGFVLWDPEATTPFPNHGEAADLGIPAVHVGKAGTPALVQAFTGKPAKAEASAKSVTRGRTSAKKATLQTPVERVELRTANVAGKLAGNGESDKTIVIGAHMDHLGHGTDTSLAPGSAEIHNGADDNASGVAVMIETCGDLADIEKAKRPFDVVCIAFGAEEMGLLGSKHYVKSLPEPERKRIAAMLNFDMVGRLGPDGLVVAGAGTSKVWADLLDDAKGDLVIKLTEDGYGPSDHGSFYEAGIPVLHFFTGPHEDYHRPTDDLEKINVDGAARVGAFALAIATELQARRIVPDYVETQRPAQRGGGFKVSLGTIPDYGAKVDGVRLSGVRKGGAAEVAGMKKGDVIKKIGTREIHNLDDYMAAFAEMKPNEKVVVVVERDGKTLDLATTPQGPRSQ